MVFNKPILLASAAALALTACTDPSTPTDNPRQRTQEGAVAGAVAGGVIGILTGDNAKERRNRGLAGAVVGGVVGGAIGYNLDKQAEELQAGFSDGRIDVINNGDNLVVRMPEGILFDVDSAAIKGTVQNDLRVLAQSLNKYPASTVQVVGHTDNTGTAGYNQDLSERRAGAVAGILTGAGVSPGRINAVGRGESQPISSNLTAEGRAQNRRVDITIIPNRS